MKKTRDTQTKPTHGEIDRDALESISTIFRALSDVTRLQLIQALRGGPKNVGYLVTSLSLTQANVSKHLQTLYDARILTRKKQGTATYYSIDDNFIFPLCELVCDKINRDNKGITTAEFRGPEYNI
ncbi:MAG: ArsR/SmtB family transcription factor [Akkermansiaceae bacterium]